MINIPGYTYVAHAIVSRPAWNECRFTVADLLGNHIVGSFPVSSLSLSDEEISTVLYNYLSNLNFTPPPNTHQFEIWHQDGTTSIFEVEL